jgi:catechol 2,3-dioxygenase-like lactoylglutathione lyase family enzyme
MKVLLITRSDDGGAVTSVAKALRARGAEPIRFDTDFYPTQVQLSTRLERGTVERRLVSPDGSFLLDEVGAVWYRRFFAGGRLGPELGDLREPSVNECRRTVYGMIAGLGCFELDPLWAVRHTDHKELQLRRAHEVGLDTPRTLITNDPAQARRFFEDLGGRVVTKMQSSFAVYRQGHELVVFTNPVAREDLEDLEGLRYCPMTFQEHLEKRVELRATVVGQRVFTAQVDSQQTAQTEVDWRRDGVGLLHAWHPYALPPEVERALVELVACFGLNYAAADFVVTPEGRHVFLEINAGGEWEWIERSAGLPIGEAIAQVLLGEAPRLARKVG